MNKTDTFVVTFLTPGLMSQVAVEPNVAPTPTEAPPVPDAVPSSHEEKEKPAVDPPAPSISYSCICGDIKENLYQDGPLPLEKEIRVLKRRHAEQNEILIGVIGDLRRVISKLRDSKADKTPAASVEVNGKDQ